MHSSHKGRHFSVPDSGRANTPVLVASAVLAMAIAYVMLLAQPGLVKGVSALWSRLPGAASTPSWTLPAVAAGVAIGGAAIGVALLSAFVRGVQARPYLWLAPVLIGFSSLVMGGLPVALPWSHVPVPQLTALIGLSLLGGGAVMQMRGAIAKCAGAVLIAAPLCGLVAGYAALPGGFAALSRLDASAQLFLFVLALTSTGICFLALITQRGGHPSALLEQHLHVQNQRLADAERRALQAEHALQAARGGYYGASDAEAAEFAALARPGLPTWALAAAGGALLSLLLGGLYFGAYRPLERRLQLQQSLAAEATREHAAEIDALRERFQTQRLGLEQALRAAQGAPGTDRTTVAPPPPPAAASPAAPAPAAPAPAPAVAADAQRPQVAAPAAPAAAASPEPRAKPRSQRARQRVLRAKTAAPQPKAAQPAKPAQPSQAAAPAEAGAEFDRETRKALSERISDDPLDGL